MFPYTEADNHMVNLDAAPASPRSSPCSPARPAVHGAFPAGLVNTDANNISPRVGVAWRVARATILRAGYSITYNAGSYATIARQLVGQPPFASTD